MADEVEVFEMFVLPGALLEEILEAAFATVFFPILLTDLRIFKNLNHCQNIAA